ncbi:hypothetical protein [Tenacibaculum discolor]|uniref:hypothetical protein n=1 Tax=Tenacibaculum discolor TaxID=361581 RepID=UPI003F790645
MKKAKAISILQKQIDKLEFEENLNNRWTIETRTYLSTFFGDESEQHKHLENFRWKPSFGSDPREYKHHISSFLKDCINTINNIGIKKDPVDNWFAKLPDWAINLGLPALCFISFGIGVVFTNNNNSELRKENLELKKRIKLVSSDSISKRVKH